MKKRMNIEVNSESKAMIKLISRKRREKGDYCKSQADIMHKLLSEEFEREGFTKNDLHEELKNV